MITKVFAALISTFCFGAIFQIRGKRLFFACIGGGIGYLVFLSPLPQEAAPSALLASCALTLYSEVMARIFKSPATVFLVGGLIPILPGSVMYRCMYEFLEGNLQESSQLGYQAMLQAGAIAVGIVVVSSLVRLLLGGYRKSAAALRAKLPGKRKPPKI